MELQQIRDIILKELPELIQTDTAFRESVLKITRFQFADKAETESRFELMMARLERLMDEEHQNRQENQRRWEENQQQIAAFNQQLAQKIKEDQRKWEDTQKQIADIRADMAKKNDEDRQKWEDTQKQIADIRADMAKKYDEDRQKWAENQRKWEDTQKQIADIRANTERKNEEDRQKWVDNQKQIADIRANTERKNEEDRQKWAENKRQWEEQQAEYHQQTKDFNRRNEQLMGAVGRRWGLHSEASFRNALSGILKDFQGVEVLNVVEWDEDGIVFGHPDQIELDIIIKNGVLIVCELKSSVGKSDMYIFDRKVRFYQQLKARQVTRKLVISPLVDEYAMPVAEKLGIEVYSYADDVDL